MNNIIAITKECGLNGDAILAIEVDNSGYGEDVVTLQPEEQNVELFFLTLDQLNAKNTRYAFR